MEILSSVIQAYRRNSTNRQLVLSIRNKIKKNRHVFQDLVYCRVEIRQGKERVCVYWKTIVGEDEVIKRNMALAQKKDYTAEYLEALPEDERAEIINGQLFYFAAPKILHQRLVLKLAARWFRFIEEHQGTCEVLTAPVAVRLDKDDKTLVEPDMILICDPEKIKEDAVWGAPDLVIEVVSKSTRHRDYGIKTLKYRTAGVKEYWIVDPEKELVMVYWFKDESQNDCYAFDEEIVFHLFPEMHVRIRDWIPADADVLKTMTENTPEK